MKFTPTKDEPEPPSSGFRECYGGPWDADFFEPEDPAEKIVTIEGGRYIVANLYLKGFKRGHHGLEVLRTLPPVSVWFWRRDDHDDGA